MDDAARFHHNFDNCVADLFRLAERDHGLTVRRLAALAGLPQSTVATWATGNTSMPAWAFFRLAKYIPDDLTTLCAELSDKAIVSNEGGGCIDALGREAASFTASYVDAKSDGVIDHRETHALNHRRRRLFAVAAKAVA